jgi:hypothetical protein
MYCAAVPYVDGGDQNAIPHRPETSRLKNNCPSEVKVGCGHLSTIRMSQFALSRCLAAAVLAVVTANYTPTSVPTCYKEGERCMGAEGHPLVPYLGCCAGFVCEGKRADWGKSCSKKLQPIVVSPIVDTTSRKCYRKNERCEGAVGHSAVPNLGCCSGFVCEGTLPTWGKSCVKESTPSTSAPILTTEASKCYQLGERCEGAYGYPAVPSWGCCNGHVCEGKRPDWGWSCIKQPTIAPYVSPPATLPPPQGRTCYKPGERCRGANGYPVVPFLYCCDGYVCEGARSDWGRSCVPQVPSKTTTPLQGKCYMEGERCIGADGHPAVPYLECCPGYACKSNRSDWGLNCVKL